MMKIGARIGPRIIIAGPASKNMPTMNNKMLINNSKNNGSLVIETMNIAKSSAACDKLTTVLNAIAAPTSNKTTPEVVAERIRTPGTSLSLSVRNTIKPKNAA